MIPANVILKALPKVLKKTDFSFPGAKIYRGKVRDIYILGDQRIQITTDRQSAFDVILGYIPFKGAVLNLLSEFWFQKTKDIIPNHLISVPDPNVMVVKSCQPLPVEIVVRGHLTGVTKTSIWTSYSQGERLIYGIKFPDGLRKNQNLPAPIITPTTKAGKKQHDQRLTREEIISRKIVGEKLYEQVERVSFTLYDFASRLLRNRGLILDDTKFEFGLLNGELTLIDEIFTPDSSRFWLADSYEERYNKDLDPENFDKEFLRLWYKEKGFTGEGKPPKMPEKLIVDLAQRYVAVYEMITGQKFPMFAYPIEERIKNSLGKA